MERKLRICKCTENWESVNALEIGHLEMYRKLDICKCTENWVSVSVEKTRYL